MGCAEERGACEEELPRSPKERDVVPNAHGTLWGALGNEATPRGALWEPRERCESVVGAWEQGNVRGAGMGAVGTKTIGNETKDE